MIQDCDLSHRSRTLGTRLTKQARLVVSTAARYRKPQPAFSDTLAVVRLEI